MSPKSNNLSLIGIIGLILLIGAVGYLLMSNSSLKKQLNEKKQSFLELEKIHTELDQNYESALADLEELRGDNQELNSLIDSQKLELEKQKNRISGLIWSERELGKVKTEMANLKKLADGYVAEIKTLRESNASLKDENSNLTSTNQNLSQELSVNKERVTKLDSMQKILVKTKEQLEETNTTLSSQVDMAEAIKINFIEVKAYDDNGDGKVKEKSKAKKANMLRTCFTTETNMVTKADDKKFYLRFTSPTGELLYVEELGSGVLKNKLTGENVRYTTSGTANYKNNDMHACIDWKPNFNLMKGNYTIEIFQNGYNVGNGTFRLK